MSNEFTNFFEFGIDCSLFSQAQLQMLNVHNRPTSKQYVVADNPSYLKEFSERYPNIWKASRIEHDEITFVSDQYSLIYKDGLIASLQSMYIHSNSEIENRMFEIFSLISGIMTPNGCWLTGDDHETIYRLTEDNSTQGAIVKFTRHKAKNIIHQVIIDKYPSVFDLLHDLDYKLSPLIGRYNLDELSIQETSLEDLI